MSLKIYVAGPDVFLPDFGAAIFAEKKRLCREAGFAGISPLDGETDLQGLSAFAQGLAIYRGNLRHMQAADAVIAHMTPFRGASMDSGTAFEMGYMAALGKPVLGYSNVAAPYAERAERYYAEGRHLGADAYTSGTTIERFDMADNLMMAGAVEASGFEIVTTRVPPGQELTDLMGFEACLRVLKRRRERGSP